MNIVQWNISLKINIQYRNTKTKGPPMPGPIFRGCEIFPTTNSLLIAWCFYFATKINIALSDDMALFLEQTTVVMTSSKTAIIMINSWRCSLRHMNTIQSYKLLSNCLFSSIATGFNFATSSSFLYNSHFNSQKRSKYFYSFWSLRWYKQNKIYALIKQATTMWMQASKIKTV